MTFYKLHRLTKIVNYIIIGYYTKVMCKWERRGQGKTFESCYTKQLLWWTLFLTPLRLLICLLLLYFSMWPLTRALTVLKLSLLYFLVISEHSHVWLGLGEDQDPERRGKLLKIMKHTSRQVVELAWWLTLPKMPELFIFKKFSLIEALGWVHDWG